MYKIMYNFCVPPHPTAPYSRRELDYHFQLSTSTLDIRKYFRATINQHIKKHQSVIYLEK